MTVDIAKFMRRLEGIWDDHQAALFDARDPQAAFETAVAEPSVWNLPVRTGGDGREAVLRFFAEELVDHLPDGLTRRRISRTVDRWHIAEEVTVSFTHDRELPWLLPGVAATHRPAATLTMTVVTFERGALAHQRTLWDHSSLCAQLGISPALAASAAG